MATMPEDGDYCSPAGAHASNTEVSNGASSPSYAPQNPANIYPTYGSTHILYVSRGETRPLLSQRSPRPVSVSFIGGHLASFLKIVLAWAIIYAIYFSMAVPAKVGQYKALCDVAWVETTYLTKIRLVLEGELSDLRGRLKVAKVDAFWEMARAMDTNMFVMQTLYFLKSITHAFHLEYLRDVWVGADEADIGPKFWSHGITRGISNANNPPITSTKLHFTAGQVVVVESTKQKHIVGYRVESNRRNNGWWTASGLNEFGNAGFHQLRFSAKQGPQHNGAEYDVIVFYAAWNH